MPFAHRPEGQTEHSLLLHEGGATAGRRMASRVADALHRGEKVIHTHTGSRKDARDRIAAWLPPGVEPGPQLELVAAREEHAATDGLHSALLDALQKRIAAGREEGFQGITCTVDDAAVVELTAGPDELIGYERGLHGLAEDPDIKVLCCYRLDQLVGMRPGLDATLAGLHFARIDEAMWTVRMRGGLLCFGGELDHSNAHRVREVLLSAQADAVRAVDLKAVTYVASEAVRAFEAVAERAAAAEDEVRLIRVPAIVHEAFTIAGLTGREGIVVQPSEPSNPQATGERGDTGSSEALRVAEMFSELTRLAEATDESQATAGLARILAEVIAPAADVSVTVGAPANPTVVDSNSRLAQRLDGLQMQAAEGPCQSAWEERKMVLTADLREDPRWPALTALAAGTEVVSVLALPVRTGEEVVGVINAYSTEVDAFARFDIALAELAAFAVGQVFARIEATRHLHDTVDNLRHALSSRAVIEQAKGILMARHGYDPEGAFDALAELSQRHNVKVRDLALLLTDDVREE